MLSGKEEPMATIDLIVLGMLKKKALSAYDIQKLVKYRNISRWVRISTPSIYKKVIQLEEKGLVRGTVVQEGKMPGKVVYSLTPRGEQEFDRLMLELSGKPVEIYLDLNAVIVNLEHFTPGQQKVCLDNIENHVRVLKSYLEDNICQKAGLPGIPETGMAVLHQQFILAQAIETWVAGLKEGL